MSKPKYPFEKRLEVVNHYFTTDDGYRIISARFGVPRTQVRTWVALYEKHGEKRFKFPNLKALVLIQSCVLRS